MKQDKKTFLNLYSPIHESFARFCHAKAYKVMEPEDLISDSVLAALESFHKVKNEDAFLSFMFSIANNILNKKRRRAKFIGFFNESHVCELRCPDLDAETKYDIEVLYQFLEKLPLKQKEALILFEISGFSLKEIALIQESSLSSVKQRLKRGREKLADLFKSEELRSEPVSIRSSVLISMFFINEILK
ncbi:MAG: RNA polymerase sigma factor [Salibacteraceae bacterium]